MSMVGFEEIGEFCYKEVSYLLLFMAKTLIIFGSTGGNTELVADKVAQVLKNAVVQRAEQTEIKDLEKYPVIIFASSTYGHGVLQKDFQPLYEKLKKVSFAGKKMAVIGLGDFKYELYYHMESANILENLVKENGGELLMPPLRISKSPVPHLNSIVKKWAEKLAKKIK